MTEAEVLRIAEKCAQQPETAKEEDIRILAQFVLDVVFDEDED